MDAHHIYPAKALPRTAPAISVIVFAKDKIMEFIVHKKDLSVSTPKENGPSSLENIDTPKCYSPYFIT